MSLVGVQGTKFIRDTDNMALMNLDASGLQEYQVKRRIMQSQREEINKVKSDMNDMKTDMKDIKDLLQKLLDKTNG